MQILRRLSGLEAFVGLIFVRETKRNLFHFFKRHYSGHPQYGIGNWFMNDPPKIQRIGPYLEAKRVIKEMPEEKQINWGIYREGKKGNFTCCNVFPFPDKVDEDSVPIQIGRLQKLMYSIYEPTYACKEWNGDSLEVIS